MHPILYEQIPFIPFIPSKKRLSGKRPVHSAQAGFPICLQFALYYAWLSEFSPYPTLVNDYDFYKLKKKQRLSFPFMQRSNQ